MGYPQFVDAVCLTAMTIYNHPRYKEQGMTVEDMLETFFSQLCAVKRARWAKGVRRGQERGTELPCESNVHGLCRQAHGRRGLHCCQVTGLPVTGHALTPHPYLSTLCVSNVW